MPKTDSDPGRVSPGVATQQSPPDSDPDFTGRSRPPVGAAADVQVLLVGALLWAAAADVTAVLALIDPADVAAPVAVILRALRRLAATGQVSPALVGDELRRAGELARPVAQVLTAATTSGASDLAARPYGAAVVAEALRRQVESAGRALIEAADGAAEDDLPVLATRAAEGVTRIAERLAALRGGEAG